MSQLRGLDELVGLVGVWAYTRYSGLWEMSLLKLPRSVGWKFLYSEWRSSWNGMYDGRDGLSVWADTAWISTGEGSLMEMPRSVESSWIEEGRARGWTYGGRYGLCWVCTYGTIHPRSMECAGHRSLLFVERLGIRVELERKSTPVESSGIESRS
jgi:hypothetical protein